MAPLRRKSSTRKPARAARPVTWRQHAGNALTSMSVAATNALKKKLGLNTEQKNFDNTGASVVGSTIGGIVDPSSGIAQGNTNTTRAGNSLRITHWTVKGNINTNPANLGSTQVRLMVTYQPTLTTAGTVVTANQLLQVSNNVNSPYNTDLEGVSVLYDKTYVLPAQSVALGTSTTRYKIKINPPYQQGHVQWTDADTTGANANLIKGFYRFWIMTDQAIGLAPTVFFYSRVHYVDN